MASPRKSYFLSPSWSLEPSEVVLGSVIVSLNSPHQALSAETLPSAIGTEIQAREDKDCSGTVKSSGKLSVGLFSTFINIIELGDEVSYSSSSSSEVKYFCESMETKRFTPSPVYITKAVDDPAVKAHLKIGGIGAKVFVVTGVKTVKGVTITTTEETKQDTKVHIGAEIPPAQLTMGSKVGYRPKTYQTHTKTVTGPIVFAFEVEKLRIDRKDEAAGKEVVTGVMLGQKDDVEYVIERAGDNLDEDEMDDFGMEACSGLEDETTAACQIIMPFTD